MFSSKNQKIIIGVAVIGILGYWGYYFYSSNSYIPSVDILISGNTEPVGQDIIILAEKLNLISLDTEVFSSALFTNLKDLSSVISPESQGRNNPFAELGVENSATVIQALTRIPSEETPKEPAN